MLVYFFGFIEFVLFEEFIFMYFIFKGWILGLYEVEYYRNIVKVINKWIDIIFF